MPKQKIKLAVSLVIIALAVTQLYSQSDRFNLKGYYKVFCTGFEPATIQWGDQSIDDPPLGSVTNRLRLSLSLKLSSWLTFQASYDLSPRIQDPSLFEGDIFYSGIDPHTYRVVDFKERIIPGEHEAVSSFGLYHNLDRCFATIKTPIADIYIGRQAIAWGSAKFINPTDVIAPYTFNQLDTEERIGVDALRVRIPLGMMDELDIGYIPGKDFKYRYSAFFMRGKFNLLHTDVSALLLGFRQHLLIGFDIARAIGGAGFWLEAAYVIPNALEKESASPEDTSLLMDDSQYLRVSLGLDYNFSGKLYGFFEYHFNSAGKSNADEYESFFLSTAFQEGAVYLMAKHYLNVGVTYQMTPLVPFTALVIANLNDGSFTVAPSVEYNIAENIYLAAGAYLSLGRKSEWPGDGLTSADMLFGSEFGAYPQMVYTSFRFYF